MWLKHPDLKEIVTKSWEMVVTGSDRYVLCFKLNALKRLNQGEYGGISSKATKSNEDFKEAMDQSLIKLGNDFLKEQVTLLRKKNTLDKAEISFFRQRAKCTHLVKADKDLEILGQGPTLDVDARDALIVNITLEEIEGAFFDIGNDKAPGPDGDFRPIECTNVAYKTITKVLTNWMLPYLPLLVDSAQGAFVGGKNLSDDVFLAQELVRGYTRKRASASYMTKVDIRKAYDTIS
ncbi:hypothetical protein LIER_08365 [Lithospermum erythrorhizon]|uniref:Reverse transcriptase domain-containing protein n=1 Tax=Lithospermum erythrorhizon TaxID=34254 RepID=A0AAV3PDM8_LITER